MWPNVTIITHIITFDGFTYKHLRLWLLKCALFKKSDKIQEIQCLNCQPVVIVPPQNVVICLNEMKYVEMVSETQSPIQILVIPGWWWAVQGAFTTDMRVFQIVEGRGAPVKEGWLLRVWWSLLQDQWKPSEAHPRISKTLVHPKLCQNGQPSSCMFIHCFLFLLYLRGIHSN